MAWIVPFIGPIISVVGMISSANAQKKQGEQQQQLANYQAQQLEAQMGQERASAQRAAIEERRRSQLAQSRALALAAKGGGASDPSVVDVISDLEGEGAYRSMVRLYQGDENARVLQERANATRYGGNIAASAGRTNATATLLKGGSSLYSKYAAGHTGSGADLDTNYMMEPGGSY